MMTPSSCPHIADDFAQSYSYTSATHLAWSRIGSNRRKNFPVTRPTRPCGRFPENHPRYVGCPALEASNRDCLPSPSSSTLLLETHSARTSPAASLPHMSTAACVPSMWAL